MILILPLEGVILRTLLIILQELLCIDQVIGYFLLLLLLRLFPRVPCSFFPLPVLLLSSPLHLYSQQLPRCPDCIFPSSLTARLAVADSLSLERRCATIEDEDGLDADEEELAYSAKETNNMAVAQRVSFLVSHCFEELVNPNGGIHGEPLLVQRLDLNRPRAGLQDSPETGDTHGDVPKTRSIGLKGYELWQFMCKQVLTGIGSRVIARPERVLDDDMPSRRV